ncbi:hypothetical protein HY522_07810 [bacterium]|nr:hypothetical protein [bacterium]
MTCATYGGLGAFKLEGANHVHPVVNRPDAEYADIGKLLAGRPYLKNPDRDILERIFILHRATLSMLFNFAQSGHPGGSISVSRALIVLFLTDRTAYDIADPWRRDADIVSLAAGHKAMGWYAFNAILNEAVRQARPDLLSQDPKRSLFLEDLLGFRKNESVVTPLRKKFGSKCLDGHPTPATPFTHLATGASGVGAAATVGLAIAARDVHRLLTPRVYCIEGEGGMTPGRVEESLQIAERAQLGNFILVVDHNDASIDVPGVCAGDYTFVKPEERGLLHGFNTAVADGKNFDEVVAAFDYACQYFEHVRPAMIVLRTEKGEGYGLGTNKSHGAGHKMNSDGYAAAQKIYRETFGVELPKPPAGGGADSVEADFWNNLLTIRRVLQKDAEMREFIAERINVAQKRLGEIAAQRKRFAATAEVSAKGNGAGAAADLSAIETLDPERPPAGILPKPGDKMALRESLARTLGEINRVSKGGVFIAAADLYGSLDFPKGIDYVPVDADHLDGRVVATGITEDAFSGVLAGISAYGRHIGAGGSYAAFMTPMGFTAARLLAIGHEVGGRTGNPLILVGGHAGPKTGEDGPTHADPQALSAWASFPKHSAVTLTPWDSRELWPLVIAALRSRPKPAVIVPFVTRPQETVIDRATLGLAPAEEAVKGVYPLFSPREGKVDAYVVMQGSAVVHELVANEGEVLLDILASGLNIGFIYVASPELFDAMPEPRRAALWNEDMSRLAMGVTDFTLDTLMRWIPTDAGRMASLHPFKAGRFLGSGVGPHVLKQGGLAGEDIRAAVIAFAKRKKPARPSAGSTRRGANQNTFCIGT